MKICKYYELTAPRGSSRSGGAPSHLTATFVADALASGELQRHVLDTLQPSYSSRYRSMISAIETNLLPLGVKIPQPDRDVVGGYFIWLTLPSSLRGAAVAQRVKKEENLIVAQGELFEVPGDTDHASFPHDLRLCFAWEDEDRLAEGIRRLASVIRNMQNDNGGVGAAMQPTTGDSRGKDAVRNFW